MTDNSLDERAGRSCGPGPHARRGPMTCRTCGAAISYTGPAVYFSRVTGLGYLAPVVHSASGLEAGADGHTAAPTFLAAFDTPPPVGPVRLAAA